jgi:hypothetical protein
MARMATYRHFAMRSKNVAPETVPKLSCFPTKVIEKMDSEFRWLLSAVSAYRGHFCLALVAGQRQILSSGGEIDIQSSL